MASTMFMRVDEVAEELGVSVPYAYKLIRSMNAELKKTGCIRRGAGRPFQRAALLGEATAVAGGTPSESPRHFRTNGAKVS